MKLLSDLIGGALLNAEELARTLAEAKVSLHAVHSNGEAMEILGVLGQYRREDAGDNVSRFRSREY